MLTYIIIYIGRMVSKSTEIGHCFAAAIRRCIVDIWITLQPSTVWPVLKCFRSTAFELQREFRGWSMCSIFFLGQARSKFHSGLAQFSTGHDLDLGHNIYMYMYYNSHYDYHLICSIHLIMQVSLQKISTPLNGTI